ncbi:MAG: LytTR family transcriptional regulator [Bacteroidia bacterium]|nr:LytTR family transcriptional regulator [Bacteroidia bacterium]
MTALEDETTFQSAKDTCPQQYLVKPWSRDDLHRAIELALFNFQSIQKPPAEPWLLVKDHHRIKKIRFEEILWIEAYGNLKKIFIHPKRFEVVRHSMEELEHKFNSPYFLLTHRGYMVNLKHFTRLEGDKIFIGDIAIPVARTHQESVRARIQGLI